MVLLKTLLASVAIMTVASALPQPKKHHHLKSSAAATSPACGSASSPQSSQSGPKAVYFMTNAAENEIVALRINTDGTLSDGSITATGGKGVNGIDQTAGGPAAPDALFSQSAVKVEGNTLVAVNPGDNTVSLFSVSSTDPTKLTLVGKPADTLGEFPVSVTISTALKMVCVANSGAVAGIACFSITLSGLTAVGDLRPIDLGQTTPATGPFNTISQTAFTSDNSMLITTVKGDPTKNNTGFLQMFAIANGAVSTVDQRVSPPGTAVLFGYAELSANSIFVTDASFGATTLTIGPPSAAAAVSNSSTTAASTGANSVTVGTLTKILDQSATCWAAILPANNKAFVTDVAVNHLVEIDPSSGSIITEFNSTNGNPGMIDLAASGSFIYALSPGKTAATGANVAVFDVSGNVIKEVQNFGVKAAGSASQGMTLF